MLQRPGTVPEHDLTPDERTLYDALLRMRESAQAKRAQPPQEERPRKRAR
jgi:hypothetical protein